MDNILKCLAGFLILGLLGWLSSLLLKAIDRLSDEERLLLREACLRSVILILLLVTLLGTVTLSIFALLNEWLPGFFLAVFLAVLMSFHLGQIRYNWKKVSDIFKILSEKRKMVKFEETIKGSQTKSEADTKELSRTDQTTKPIFNSYDFNKSQKIIDIKKLINENERRLQKLKEKQARLGPDTRPADLMEIEDTEIEIEKLQAQLKELEDDAR